MYARSLKGFSVPVPEKITPSYIDVRTRTEFEEKHIVGSENIPMHEVLERFYFIKELPRPIIVFCRSGNRSGWVAELFKEKGISAIYNGGSVEDIGELGFEIKFQEK